MVDSITLNLLKRTRLTDHQAAVYLATLQLGKAPVSTIAEHAGLKRTHAYVVLQSLEQIGYVEQVPGTKKKAYVATDPTAFVTELEQTTNEFKEMLPYLCLQQQKAGKPKVMLHEGMTGLDVIFKQIHRPKEARYAISINQALLCMSGEVDRWKRLFHSGKAKPGGYHLLSDSPADREYGELLVQSGQHVRYLEAGIMFEMDLALVDGVIYLMAFRAEPFVLTIESPELYRSMCTLYDMAWKKGRFSF